LSILRKMAENRHEPMRISFMLWEIPKEVGRSEFTPMFFHGINDRVLASLKHMVEVVERHLKGSGLR